MIKGIGENFFAFDDLRQRMMAIFEWEDARNKYSKCSKGF